MELDCLISSNVLRFLPKVKCQKEQDFKFLLIKIAGREVPNSGLLRPPAAQVNGIRNSLTEVAQRVKY